jgi:hypothetical protein
LDDVALLLLVSYQVTYEFRRACLACLGGNLSVNYHTQLLNPISSFFRRVAAEEKNEKKDNSILLVGSWKI